MPNTPLHHLIRAVRVPLASVAFSVSCGIPIFGANASADLGDLACSVPRAYVADGGPGKDGIPALTNPLLVAATDAGAAYLRPDDRVVGLELDGQFIAVPLNIGWWHEVVNLNGGAARLAVTHCPLTGSSLVFNRSAVEGAEFGVSGLLYLNNLMMYDRATPESLWPQMLRGARCGRRDGVQLPMHQAVEMRWDGWRSLHPSTRVVSSATGHARNYQLYPYGDYAREDNAQLLAPIPSLNSRRPPKERVLGIVSPEGPSVALPFGLLRAAGAISAVSVSVGTIRAVVFWDSARESAAAFNPVLGTDALTFRVAQGRIVDDQTGSEWASDGRAVAGPRAGARLTSVADSFVAYWFAWAAFYPETVVWSAP